MASETHPLRAILEDAVHGRFPDTDGAVTVLPESGGTAAVVGFTAAHFILADVAEAEVRAQLDSSDVGAPMRPQFLAWLAGKLDRECGYVDLLMARRGRGGGSKALHLAASSDSPRMERARRFRHNLAIHVTPDGTGTVILGTGLVGRLEISIELEPAGRFAGAGRALLLDALRAVEPHETVFAQVSPGNAASVRAFLAAGFKPIGSEALLAPSAEALASPP